MSCCKACALNKPCESNCPDHDHKVVTMGMTPDVAHTLAHIATAERDRKAGGLVVGADQSTIQDGRRYIPNTKVPAYYPEMSIVGMDPDAMSACLAGACQRTRERVAIMGRALSGGRVLVTTPGTTRLPVAPARKVAQVDGRWIPGRPPMARPPTGYTVESRKLGARPEWRPVPLRTSPPPRADIAPPPGLACVGPWRNDAGPKPSNYQQIGDWWRSCYAYDAPQYNANPSPNAPTAPGYAVSNEDGAYLDQLQALLGALMAMSDADLAATLRSNSWLLDLLMDLGLLPQNTAVVGFDMADVRKADDVFSNVWDNIKQYVPYGQVIDQVHQTRRDLMYGADPVKSAAAPTPAAPLRGAALMRASMAATKEIRPAFASTTVIDLKAALVRRMQGLWRRRWRGDRAADAEIAALKERAATGDPVGAREWAVYVEVARDDIGRVA